MVSHPGVDLVHRFFSGTGPTYDHMVNLWTIGFDIWWKKRILEKIPGPFLNLMKNRLTHGGGDDVSKELLDRVEQMLKKRQNSLYEANGERPIPVEDPNVSQGVLEGSNVRGVVEMTRLINVVRSYQASQRLLDKEDQLQRKAIEALSHRAA